MDSNEEFVKACYVNNVKEVKRMITEEVNINAANNVEVTGLMQAMFRGNTEVSRILLGCKNIKIDIKDIYGNTALHNACIHNRIESVKLFLEHPTCNKDIVRIENNWGNTSEMIADKRGDKECAKLIREYLENNDDRALNGPTEDVARSVDDLVEFINGVETKKKKKKNRKKNPLQSATRSDMGRHSGDNNRITGNIGVKDSKDDIKTKSKASGKNNTDKKVDTEKQDSRDDPKNANLIRDKERLEEKIAEKAMHYNAHEESVKEIIDIKSIEIKNLDSMIEKSQDEKNIKLEEVDKLSKQLSDLESKMAKIKWKMTELLGESKNYDKRIQKYEKKKNTLEDDIKKELENGKEKGNVMKYDIQNLETRLEETEKLIQNLQEDDELIYEPNKEFLEFINEQIIEKERELECPVCLEVACSPIFMCSEQHLICSTCRPKLSNCPECSVVYKGKNRRHRYAEKTAEELERLKKKKDQVRK